MVKSAIISTIFTISGLVISYSFDITSGASIILVSATCLIIFLFFKKVF